MCKRVVWLLFFAVTLSFARDKQNWLKVQSPHFLIVTDGSEKQGRHVADQFERMRIVFHQNFPNLEIDPASPIIVIATKDEKDFRALEPQDYLGKGKLELAGLFLRAPDKNYILLRLDAQGEHPFEIVYHEYTHLLSAKAEAWLPLWLNEGLAEFYQTTEIRDKDALLGQPSLGNLQLLRQNRLLPLPVLFAVDRNSPYYHEENKGSIFYAEAWALTHYLEIHDFQEHKQRLVTYANLVAGHVDGVTAATRAFGDLHKLQQNLEDYVAQSRFTYFRMPVSAPVDESDFKVEPVPVVEADAVRADFLACNRRTADARALLDEVLKDDPNNASAHETMGYLAFQEHDLDAARKWYGEAVQLNSQSFLANYYYASIAMSSGSLSSADEALVETSLHTAIKLNPQFAASYDRLGAFYGMRHRNLDEALSAELKATQLEPESFNFKLNCANILMEMDRTKEAIALARSSANMAKSPADEMRLQNFLQQAESYESAKERTDEYNRRISQGSVPQSSSAVTSDSGPPVLARRPVGNSYPGNAPSLPETAPSLPEKDATGPHRFVTGTIKNVECSGLGAIDFTVVSAGKAISVHAPNYYKIQFSALGFTPDGDLQPCSQIEGKPAKIEFIEPADKTIRNRIVAVELHK
jgi:tetratricopeptide (TPR) repeat protein